MIDYSTVENTHGSYPETKALNASGPLAKDGTPYHAAVIDDLWGFNQALMSAANMFPNGVTETVEGSQRLEAIRRIAGYPGEVVPWMGNEKNPLLLGIRLLPLNGQTISRALYAQLDEVTYVGDGKNSTAPAFYRVTSPTSGIRNTTGQYLVLPDLRGLAIRGLDISGTKDFEGARRSIGDEQLDSVIDHSHSIGNLFYGGVTTPVGYALGGIRSFDVLTINEPPDVTVATAVSWDANVEPSAWRALGGRWVNPIAHGLRYDGALHGAEARPIADESRMRNAAVHWMIRY
jgi:hypothetical protein